MKEIDSKVKSEFMQSLNAVLKANGKEELPEDAKRQIGNNGYYLGQEFTLTGKVEPVVAEINGNKSVYIGLETKEGGYLSLQRVMGLSSLAGYITEGSAINEYNDNGTKQSDTVSATVKTGITLDTLQEKAFKPDFRDLYDEAAYLVAHPEIIRDTKLYYSGKVVRQIVAKKKVKNAFSDYDKGYKRAMSAPIFTKELL